VLLHQQLLGTLGATKLPLRALPKKTQAIYYKKITVVWIVTPCGLVDIYGHDHEEKGNLAFLFVAPKSAGMGIQPFQQNQIITLTHS
jgi:hypothetical protein